MAVKGLLVAIQLSSIFSIYLDCENGYIEERLKDVFPTLITAAVKADSSLHIFDKGQENLNEIAADEIEKAGAYIDYLYIE